MMSWKRLLPLGLAVFIAGLVINLPARAVHDWLSPPALRLAGIDGSLWSGRAGEADIQGVYLRNLRWSINPWRLFAGQLAYDLKADPVGGFIDASAAVNLAGTLTLSRLNAALPLSALHGAIRNDDVGGDLSLQLSDVRIVDGWPTDLRGLAGASNLLIRALAPNPIGDYRAEFQTADDTIIGAIEDASGMLDVAATLTLRPDRSYSLVGRVAPTATATPSVVQQISFLGSPDARGLREFRLEGAL